MNRKEILERDREALASVLTRFSKLMTPEEYSAVLHAIHQTDKELKGEN